MVNGAWEKVQRMETMPLGRVGSGLWLGSRARTLGVESGIPVLHRKKDALGRRNRIVESQSSHQIFGPLMTVKSFSRVEKLWKGLEYSA